MEAAGQRDEIFKLLRLHYLTTFFYYCNRTRNQINILLLISHTKWYGGEYMIVIKEIFKESSKEERQKIITQIIIRMINNKQKGLV